MSIAGSRQWTHPEEIQRLLIGRKSTYSGSWKYSDVTGDSRVT